MVEKVHNHIIEELKTNTRNDMVFMIIAIALNFLSLAINSGIAGSGSNLLVMFVFIALVIIVNIIVEIALLKGMQTREKLLNGLLQMYKDHQVNQYYDESILQAYSTRYKLFMFAVVFTGLVAIMVPFLLLGS